MKYWETGDINHIHAQPSPTGQTQIWDVECYFPRVTHPNLFGHCCCLTKRGLYHSLFWAILLKVVGRTRTFISSKEFSEIRLFGQSSKKFSDFLAKRSKGIILWKILWKICCKKEKSVCFPEQLLGHFCII